LVGFGIGKRYIYYFQWLTLFLRDYYDAGLS